MLIDTGPLIAVINKGDQDHAACVAFLLKQGKGFVTTWPVMTEAHYFLGKLIGWPGQAALWKLVERGVVQVADSTAASVPELQRLMAKYSDVPMDLADASLDALAEARGLRVLRSKNGMKPNGHAPFQPSSGIVKLAGPAAGEQLPPATEERR